MRIIKFSDDVLVRYESLEALIIENEWNIAIILKSGQIFRPMEWHYTSFEGAKQKLNELRDILIKEA